MTQQYDAIVIGAGFFGLRIALHLRENLGFGSVLILDQAEEPMLQASRVNQARVHNGYHYPRSVLTGARSKINRPQFIAEFNDAIDESFAHYYAISRNLSKTSASQFVQFCDRIGASIAPVPEDIVTLFSPEQVEGVFEVVEPAFNWVTLRELLLDRVEKTGGIELLFNTRAERIIEGSGGLIVETDGAEYSAGFVLSSLYADINPLHERSNLPLIDMQYELTEMCLVKLPDQLTDVAFTVMDGPFFSIMPYPSLPGVHTLSHVRYTPHRRWDNANRLQNVKSNLEARVVSSNFAPMQADVSRFIPSLSGDKMAQVGSIDTVKVVLTKSENSDSRPILYRADHGVKGYTCVMGGKLDNVFDVLDQLTITLGERNS